jgi:chromosome segregation protein
VVSGMLEVMRINKIKLAGFKSFVDPTTLSLPGNLTGIVGPNGCGKSNIIDGLMWVLGESSAKHLRGNAMTDVIFNGSSSRKPVGQAVVEIIFDNSENKLSGQYASFSEISIKRTLGRDGISSYFLNGTRCRKKDITNVFLGTGVGPRGYSVIEQGTISRVIEAKPEELRAFLEEAAGISQYKERRRETETRIKRTEENLDRLSDIRSELEKQLKHLKRQAVAAERYKRLKKEERKLNGVSIAFNWSETKEEAAVNLARKEERETELQKLIAAQREIEALQTSLAQEHHEINDNFNKSQANFYSKTADISRLEQELKYLKARKIDLQKNHTDIKSKLLNLTGVIAGNDESISVAIREIDHLDPKLSACETESTKMKNALEELELSLSECQSAWDRHMSIKNKLSEDAQSKKIRLEHLNKAITTGEEKREQITNELSADNSNELSLKAESFKEYVTEFGSKERILIAKRNSTTDLLNSYRQKSERQVKQLHESELLVEKKRGELSSEKALQERALGGDQSETASWLDQKGITDATRLAEQITIEKGWEIAVETALKVPLNALCGNNIVNSLFEPGESSTANKAAITVLESDCSGYERSSSSFSLLADHVKGTFNMAPFLDGVYSAETQADAMRTRKSLKAHEVIVTKDGCLLGRYWAQLPANNSTEIGILARERTIIDLEAELIRLNEVALNLRLDLEKTQAEIDRNSKDEKTINLELNEVSGMLKEKENKFQRIESELVINSHRLRDLSRQLEEVELKSEHDVTSSKDLVHQVDLASELLLLAESKAEELTFTRRSLQNAVDEARKNWVLLRDDSHAKQLVVQDLRTKLVNSQQEQKRNIVIRTHTLEEEHDLENNIIQTEGPLNDLNEALGKELSGKLEMEKELSTLRGKLDLSSEKSQNYSKARSNAEELVIECKEVLENDRLEERTYAVKLDELKVRFNETGENFEEALASIEEKHEFEDIVDELQTLKQKLLRMEPINLAAIDEFNELSERKVYLDSQDTDLTDSLDTLKAAIRKIDTETKARFKATYDKVNNKLQETFPLLFGGGQAYLEMTDSDLLETGVTVMAQPPGKRNSSIHLLSGGEKALTALTFIFSIFDLNPAPFCLLDEVDAPLDDVNVVRLTDMLKTMSENVQFLFVSHNKITMEIAEQLIGVTMEEAGVSRLVSVDMNEAVELAAIA